LAQECLRQLSAKSVRPERITVLGLTFKENVPDIRNSKVVDIINELRKSGVAVQVHDPLADADTVEHEYGFRLTAYDALLPADAVIFAVAHSQYVGDGWPAITRLLKGGRGLVIDVKSKLDPARAPEGVALWRM
jgi:UDP-N-acetyl-D-galactosamine dehydrogenase